MTPPSNPQTDPSPRPATANAAHASDAPAARRINLSKLGLPLVVLILILGFSLKAPAFFSHQNFLNTTNVTFEIVLLAVTQACLIAGGGIDLSAGAVLGVSGMVSGKVLSGLMGHVPGPEAVIIGLLISLAIGLFIGLINGTFITYLKMAPFIITLGTSGICLGATLLISNGIDITNLPTALGSFANYDILRWLSVPVFFTIIFCIILGLVIHRTRFGAHTFAIGDSDVASRRAGIRVDRHLMWLYLLSSVIAGLAGFLVMGHLLDASSTTGSTDTLNSIAAVFVGGASLGGGRGSIPRSVLGAIVIGILATGLVISGVPPFWQEVVVGVILIAAVYLDNRTARLETRA